MKNRSTIYQKLLGNVICALAVVVFYVACTPSRVNPAYTVEYPFTGTGVTNVGTEVKARVVQVKRTGIAPLSVNGFLDLELEILGGEVPGRPERKVFWIAVREHSVISPFCAPGKELTLRFDAAGRLLKVAEFEAAMLSQQKLFPNSPQR